MPNFIVELRNNRTNQLAKARITAKNWDAAEVKARYLLDEGAIESFITEGWHADPDMVDEEEAITIDSVDEEGGGEAEEEDA